MSSAKASNSDLYVVQIRSECPPALIWAFAIRCSGSHLAVIFYYSSGPQALYKVVSSHDSNIIWQGRVVPKDGVLDPLIHSTDLISHCTKASNLGWFLHCLKSLKSGNVIGTAEYRRWTDLTQRPYRPLRILSQLYTDRMLDQAGLQRTDIWYLRQIVGFLAHRSDKSTSAFPIMNFTATATLPEPTNSNHVYDRQRAPDICIGWETAPDIGGRRACQPVITWLMIYDEHMQSVGLKDFLLTMKPPLPDFDVSSVPILPRVSWDVGVTDLPHHRCLHSNGASGPTLQFQPDAGLLPIASQDIWQNLVRATNALGCRNSGRERPDHRSSSSPEPNRTRPSNRPRFSLTERTLSNPNRSASQKAFPQPSARTNNPARACTPEVQSNGSDSPQRQLETPRRRKKQRTPQKATS